MNHDDGDARYQLPPVTNGRPEVLTKRRKENGSVAAIHTDKGGREYRSLTRPLEKYVAAGRISGPEYTAGLRLARAWECSVQSPVVQVRYEDGDGGCPPLSFVPHGFGAAQYRAAIASVTGPRHRLMVFAVCCLDTLAVNAVPFGSRRTAERLAMPLLREGLAMLVRHYRVPDE